MGFYRCGSGGGVDVSVVTATADDVVSPAVIVTSDGEPVTGNIDKITASGNTTLNASTTTKSYAAGYYPNAHGATVSVYTWS